MKDGARSFVETADLIDDDVGLWMRGHAIVQYWERPLMKQLAKFCTARRGRVLEIGYGLGLASSYISEFGAHEHVILEAHPQLAKRADAWARGHSKNLTRVVQGWWETEVSSLGLFDAILFDASPPGLDVKLNHYRDFISIAPALLKKGGCLTYVSLETRNFRSEHIQLLLASFDRLELATVSGLTPPSNCSYWSHDHMVLPCAEL